MYNYKACTLKDVHVYIIKSE